MIKFADEIIKEMEEKQVQVPNGCIADEEFEKWLRNKDTNFTVATEN